MTKASPGEPGKGRERPPDPTNKTRPIERDRAPVALPVYVAKPVAPGILALRFTFQHRD